jgi:magnesium-transporting ATPase (P-type)
MSETNEIKATDRSEPVAWHALAPSQVLDRLDTNAAGLDGAEVARRRATYGANALPEKQPPSLLSIVLHQLKSPLIYILLAAAALSIATGDVKDAGFIGFVILLNSVLGTWQEWRAEQSAAALQRMLRITARVRRDGQDVSLDAEDLVPGDVISLESGDRVPADVRILEQNGVTVDESFLTGESIASEKRIDAVAADAALGDRASCTFAGATVVSGRARGVVVATGSHTEIGRIAEATVGTKATKPPLVVRMERFVHAISFIVLAAAATLVLVALVKGTPLVQVFFLAVALAVSAIPEGLPVAMTVALSVAVRRMASRRVIVRKMTAVEGLGSCTLIASDKTGTLTVNQQTVRRLLLPSGEPLEVTGEGYSDEGEVVLKDGSEALRSGAKDLARAVVICNEAALRKEGDEWKHAGDAVDVALLSLGLKLKLPMDSLRSEEDVVGSIPFESERKYAAVSRREDGQEVVYLKGAVETVLARCEGLDVASMTKHAEDMAAEGLRVLAAARGVREEGQAGEPLTEETLPPLALLGLIGMLDPLRPEAKKAVEACRRAGVQVAMVTGDHPATALAIARELGMVGENERVVVGTDLPDVDTGTDPAFVELVRDVHVFARVAPLQKLYIVQAMRELGHFVAVTGDGVNDAPAMRAANIGVAMGSGTDLAKDTASIIVTDDNFASIVEGVEEGRFAYDNVRKVIYLLVATGFAEILLFLLAVGTGKPLPLLPVQILWLNLVTNGIQDVALAFEGGEPGAMRRPPRKPTEGVFDRIMLQQTLVSGLWMGLVSFAAWLWLLERNEEEPSRNILLLLMVLFQNVLVFACRSERVSAFLVPLSRNRVLVGGVLAAFGLHVAALYVPFMRSLLGTAPVAARDFGILAAVAVTVLLTSEILKLLRGRGDQDGLPNT